MADLRKIRVQLLDEITGEVIEEVDILTAPNAVVFADGQNLTQKLNNISLTPGPIGETGLQGTQGVQGIQGETGIQGIKGSTGATGEGFSYKEVYLSVVTMNADYSNASIPIGSYVLINTGNVEDEDTSKVYVKGQSKYDFMLDMSGAQGIKGNTGNKGDTGGQGVKGSQGIQGETGTTGARGVQGVIGITGETGEQGITGVKGQTGSIGATGATGEDGDTVRVGTDYATARQVNVFFKVV